jgi:hypothetical protein
LDVVVTEPAQPLPGRTSEFIDDLHCEDGIDTRSAR